MRGVFDDREQEAVQPCRDTELTLGSGTLVAICFGLLILCGLCFGLGYKVGHRGSSAAPSAMPQTAAQTVESSSIAKPSATPPAAQGPSLEPVNSSLSSSDPSALASTAAAQTPAEPAQLNAAPGQPQIRPALTPAVETSQPGQPGAVTVGGVRPAFAPAAQPMAAPASAGSLMVQIAAVSNPEDASVLTNALRKRGYAVTVRREPIDNLIHVRIGPFATPSEANNWKMKLLNDGYNAIVQQ
jgi:cell division septation protein DedD